MAIYLGWTSENEHKCQISLTVLLALVLRRQNTRDSLKKLLAGLHGNMLPKYESKRKYGCFYRSKEFPGSPLYKLDAMKIV